jgi:hypothetical protein
LDEQIKRYRRMKGEQRLEVALGLHELSCDVAREGIATNIPRPVLLKSNAFCAAGLNFPEPDE